MDGGANALDPNGTKLAFLHLPVPIGVLQCLLDALHSHAEAVGTATVALRHFDDFLVPVIGKPAGLLQERGGERGQQGKGACGGAGAGGDACMDRDGRGGASQEEAAQPRRGHDDDASFLGKRGVWWSANGEKAHAVDTSKPRTSGSHGTLAVVWCEHSHKGRI